MADGIRRYAVFEDTKGETPRWVQAVSTLDEGIRVCERLAAVGQSYFVYDNIEWGKVFPDERSVSRTRIQGSRQASWEFRPLHRGIECCCRREKTGRLWALKRVAPARKRHP